MGKRISTFTVDAGRIDLYVTDCASCGVIFGMTVEMETRRREDHRTWYCPNGHRMVFNGPTKAEREAKAARERADRLQTRLLAERDQAEAARKEAAAAKASEVRIRWRVGNGICPCCRRTFPGLAAHVATKHPDFLAVDIAPLSTRMSELLSTIRRATEEQDTAILDLREIGGHWGTARALENRGLITRIGYDKVALTETGWPLSEVTTP